MPIRPENAARYPRNWKTEVVPRIRARSGNRCECTGQCGWQHGPDAQGRCLRINGEIGYMAAPGDGNWVRLSLDRDRLGMECDVASLLERKRPVEIVLTVAHLDHTPENCSDGNLLHMCQGCHNRYDAPTRRAGIKQRRRVLLAAGDLFDGREGRPDRRPDAGCGQEVGGAADRPAPVPDQPRHGNPAVAGRREAHEDDGAAARGRYSAPEMDIPREDDPPGGSFCGA